MNIYPYAAGVFATLIACLFHREPEARHRRQPHRSRAETAWRLGLFWLLSAGLVTALITSMAGHDNQLAALLVLVGLLLGPGTAVWPGLTAELRALTGRRDVTELALAALLLVIVVVPFAPRLHS